MEARPSDTEDHIDSTLYDKMLEKLSDIVPIGEKDIEVKEFASPNTFEKFTLNKNGALFGWASTLEQADRNVFPPITSIKNLFLAGHWTTGGISRSGIAPVALSGKYVAKVVLRRLKDK